MLVERTADPSTSPRFPVKLCGISELHAAFLKTAHALPSKRVKFADAYGTGTDRVSVAAHHEETNAWQRYRNSDVKFVDS
jgi:hypothetical protein